MELSEHEKELFDEFFKNLKATDKTLPIDCFFPDSKCHAALKKGFIAGLRSAVDSNFDRATIATETAIKL